MITPAQIQQRLEEIERDLALRQNLYEAAAERFHRAVREREHTHAVEYMKADGNTTDRREHAKCESALIGMDAEAEFEGLRAAVKVLETRAMIGMALLKAASRV